jgi:hypothetical protein
MRTTRLAVVALLLALVGPAIGLAAPAVALAAPADAPPAYLRLAHLSPDTPKVDVYVNSAGDPSRSFVVPGVGYGAVSQYQPLPPDSYVISMRPAGAAASSPPVISATVDARSGAADTVAGTGKSANLGLSVLNDKLDIPPAGKASVRVINAALTVPSADVGPVNGPVWAKGVAFGTETGYVDCPLGKWDLAVSSSGTSSTVPLTLQENSTYTVLLIDKGTGLEPQVTRDSTGADMVPSGAIETGLGGAAGLDLLPAAVGGVAVLLLVGLAVVRSRRAAGER